MDTAWKGDVGGTLSSVIHAFDVSGELDLDLLLDKLSAIHGRSPERVTALTMCGDALYKRYNAEDDEEDLDKCIRAYDLALDSASLNLAEYPRLLASAATAYHDRFNLTDKHSDNDRAISLFDAYFEAISDTPSSSMLIRFGGMLQARFLLSKNHADLLWAINVTRKAVQLTPDSNLNLPSRASNLANLLQRLFEHSGDRAVISEAIELQQKAIEFTPDGDRLLPTWIEYLADAFLLRFRHFGDPVDINKAVESYERVVRIVPPTDIDFPLKLSSLGVALRYRFECFGNVQDVIRSIESQQEAVDLADEDPELPRMLDNLGSSLSARFERFGDLADISAAINLQRKAVDLCEDDDPDCDVRLTNLAGLLQTRFERGGDLADLEEAIEVQKKAIDLHPDTHPDLYIWLGNLGSMFCYRFEHDRGDIRDISQAIALQQKAVQRTPSSHRELGAVLTNLGLSFIKRFEQLGDTADITEAIEVLQRAVQVTLNEDPALPLRLSNLGSAFKARFDHSGDIADLGEAMKLTERAIQNTPGDHSNRSLWLYNMGSFLSMQFEHSRGVTDINEAEGFFQEAVHLLPDEHSFFPTLLSGRGDALRQRFLHSGDVDDITLAISLHQRSIQLTPPGHPDLRSHIYNLGKSFHARFKRFGDPEDIQSAISCYRRATANEHGAPLHRLSTARAWADACEEHLRDPAQLLEAYKIAIELMSQVSGLEQTIELRHTNLLQISDLACTAAAAAFTHRRPDFALEWLEQGHCLVWNQLNQLRTSVDDLRVDHPHLADQLQQLAFALEQAGSRSRSKFPAERYEGKEALSKKVKLEEEAAAHINTADKWNALLTQIRSIREFSNFLQPRKASEIVKSLHVAGAVILINVHETRCDALALIPNSHEPFHIHLPHFTHAQAVNLRVELLKCLLSAGKRMREVEPEEPPERGGHSVNPFDRSSTNVTSILGKLWRDVVRPIFDALGYLAAKKALQPRRVWWCATGPLAFLPIHAAGIYGKGGNCTSDFAISSYIPTISALINKPERNDQSLTRNRLLLVSQADAEMLPRIPGADKETDVLKKVMKKSGIETLRIAGAAATAAKVKMEMTSYDSIHFACHAHQDTQRPLESCFHLSGGVLALSEIIKQRTSAADLAFLSACQTSTGHEQLSEEAVHLAAGMLAAGYRSVVASTRKTVWPQSTTSW